MLSQQIKVQEFDKYIMQGGNQSLPDIEDLCRYGLTLCMLDGADEETFNDIVIDVIKKLRYTNNNGGFV